MRIILENTDKIVELRIGQALVPARIWEGATSSGIVVHAYITRIAVATGEDVSQFDRELKSCRAPSAEIQEIPLRLIL